MQHITRCLNSKLLAICHRAIQLEELNTKLYDYLPESLREHCLVGSFTNSCLVLITTDPVWASQLRYILPELRDKLRTEAGIYQLASIKITVAAEKKMVVTKQTRACVLSDKAREVITAGGELCDYPPLKQAFRHLVAEEKIEDNK